MRELCTLENTAFLREMEQKVYLPEVHATLVMDQNAFKTERAWLIQGEVPLLNITKD